MTKLPKTKTEATFGVGGYEFPMYGVRVVMILVYFQTYLLGLAINPPADGKTFLHIPWSTNWTDRGGLPPPFRTHPFASAFSDTDGYWVRAFGKPGLSFNREENK